MNIKNENENENEKWKIKKNWKWNERKMKWNEWMRMGAHKVGRRLPKNYIYKLPIDRLSGCYVIERDS